MDTKDLVINEPVGEAIELKQAARYFKIKKQRMPVHYEYIYLNNLVIRYHLVNMDSENYSFLIPSNYNINYSKSSNNYDGLGHVYFYTNKNTYELDYVKTDYKDFKYQVDRYKDNVKKYFSNYREQEFYEILKDNVDVIYMFYNGYMFKLSSDHKFNINEYFDMYFILYSVTATSIHNDIHLLKELTYLKEHGVTNFCNDIDMLNMDLSNIEDSLELTLNDVVINSDEAYLAYREKERKAEIIGANLFANRKEKELRMELIDEDKWNMVGTFYFGCLGQYTNGCIMEYQEITKSEELDLKDKLNLLSKTINQKQFEVISYEDKIKEQFYIYLIKYLKSHITYEIWDKHHLRDFIYLSKLSTNYEQLSDNELYKLFCNYLNSSIDVLNNWEEIASIFNHKLLVDNVIGENIVIYPNKYVLHTSALNYLFDSIAFVINEKYEFMFEN